MELIIFTDGASRGNPGHASYGYSIKTEGGKVVHEEGKYLGIATNNYAEYQAVLNSLSYVKGHVTSVSQVKVFADSKLVVEQLSGRYKVKSESLLLLVREINQLIAEIGEVSFTHVYREKNKRADELANIALDKFLH